MFRKRKRRRFFRTRCSPSGACFRSCAWASEGNARDFLILFAKAHAKYRQQTSRQKIGLEDVHTAAIDLYRGDKYMNISSEKPLEDFLEDLVHSIIKEKHARTFMVPYQSRNHPLLARLFSARILHPLNVEWSHPHNPGERYSLITMDYGTYVVSVAERISRRFDAIELDKK